MVHCIGVHLGGRRRVLASGGELTGDSAQNFSRGSLATCFSNAAAAANLFSAAVRIFLSLRKSGASLLPTTAIDLKARYMYRLT